MNIQKLLPYVSSRSRVIPNSILLRPLGRCLGTVSCAKLKVFQLPLHVPKVVPHRAVSLSMRRLCTEPQDLNSGEMDYFEFKEMVGLSFSLVIDVREPQELKDDGKILGTVNIPLGQLEAVLSMGPEKLVTKYHLSTYPAPAEGENVVFFCKAGVRAAKALAIARKHGFLKARFYKGSFLEWKEKGEMIIKDT